MSRVNKNTLVTPFFVTPIKISILYLKHHRTIEFQKIIFQPNLHDFETFSSSRLKTKKINPVSKNNHTFHAISFCWSLSVNIFLCRKITPHLFVSEFFWEKNLSGFPGPNWSNSKKGTATRPPCGCFRT